MPCLNVRIQINKQSEVPVRQQLHEQIIYLMGTGKLAVGDTLPSVRQLARQLKVHHNTVSHVYADLAREGWLVTRRGSRLVVVQRARGREYAGQAANLDELIDRTVQLAHQRGYSLQQIAARIRERLLAEPPDHLLIVEPEKGLGDLMQEEIRRATGQVPARCSVIRLQQNPGVAIGAIMLTPCYLVDGLDCLPSKSRRIISLTYAPAEGHLDAVRNLSHPSAVGMVSVSPALLKTASGLLAPVIGARHLLHEFLMEPAAGNSGGGRLSIRRYAVQEYPAARGVRSWARADHRAGLETGSRSIGGSQAKNTGPFSSEPSADLAAIDLLFCDSIT